MKNFGFLLIASVIINYSFAHNNGSCQIIGVTNSMWIYGAKVETTQTDIIGTTLKFYGLLEVEKVESKYFNVVVRGYNELIIIGNDNLSNIDKELENDEPTSVINIDFFISFKCITGKSRLGMRFVIWDRNNLDPMFSSNHYKYEVPMPMIPKYNIADLGQKITVSDLDFSNRYINVTIWPDDVFDIYVKKLPNTTKYFEVILSVKQPIRFHTHRQFTLRATDNGYPFHYSTVKLDIYIDTASTIPYKISFPAPVYSFDYIYSEINEQFHLTTNQTIVPILNTNDFWTQLDSESFNAKYYNNKVNIDLRREIDGFDKNVLVHSLNVSSLDGGYGVCTIMINIPESLVIHIPKFTKTNYIAKYYVGGPNDYKIVMNDVIKVIPENVNHLQLNIMGEYKENFQLIKIEDSFWILDMKKSLNWQILENNNEIVMKLEASIPVIEAKSYAIVVLELIHHEIKVPKFSKVIYKAIYTGENEIVLVHKNIVIEADGSDHIDARIVDDFDETFKLTRLDQSEYRYRLDLEKPLNDTILNSLTEIELVVEAQVSEIVEADRLTTLTTCTIVIDLPLKTSAISPKFSNTHYIGVYHRNKNGLDDRIILDEEIFITNYEKSQTKISIDDIYKENFEITYNHGWEISVKNNLNSNILNKNVSIIITLSATTSIKGAYGKGIAHVVVQLPKSEVYSSIQFSQIIYRGEYVIDDFGDSIDFDSDIQIEGKSLHRAEIQLNGDYSDSFAIFHNQKGNITISLNDTLPHDILQNKSILSFVLIATISETTTKASAALVVSLPKLNSIQSSLQSSRSQYETFYIATIAILALLLMASIIGVGIVYYLKLGKTNTFS